MEFKGEISKKKVNGYGMLEKPSALHKKGVAIKINAKKEKRKNI